MDISHKQKQSTKSRAKDGFKWTKLDSKGVWKERRTRKNAGGKKKEYKGNRRENF